MTRPYAARLEDALAPIAQCQRFRPYVLHEDPIICEKGMTSILHILIILGESVNHFPESVFARHPDIPWRNIIGMRHFVVTNIF